MKNWARKAEEYAKYKEDKKIEDSLSEENLLTRWGQGYDYAHKNDYGYTSLTKRWKDLYKKALGYYNNEGYKTFADKYNGTINTEGYVNKRDTDKWYRELEEMSKKDNEGIEELLAELDQYSRYYNEDAVKYVRDLISEKQKAYSDVMADAGKFRDHWAKWATEDDYNKALWESDFYSKLQSGNIGAADALYKQKYGDNPPAEGDEGYQYFEYLKSAALPDYQKYNGMSSSDLLSEKDKLSGDLKLTAGFTPADRLKVANSKMGIADYDNFKRSAELMYVDERLPYQQMLEFDLEAGQAEIDYIKGFAERADEIKKQIAAIDGEINNRRAKGRNADDLVSQKARLQMELYQLSEEYRGATTDTVLQNHNKLTGQNGGGLPDFSNLVDFDALLTDKIGYHDEVTRYNDLSTLKNEAMSLPDFQAAIEKAKAVKTPFAVTNNSFANGEANRVTYAELATNLDNPEVHAELGGVKNYARFMTNDEKNVYHALFGSGQYDKAEQYYSMLEDELKDRSESQDLTTIGQFSDKFAGTLLPSTFSVVASLGSGVEYAGDVLKYLGETKADPYRAKLDNNLLAKASSIMRGTATDKVNLNIGDFDAFDFLYNTGMSGVDSLAASVIPGGGVVLGLSAAAQATNDALERGMSSEQAFWNGAISGVFEGLFESISIGKFKSLQEGVVKGGKDIAKNIAKSMLVNASEEAATELANILYDTLANGDFSNYENMVRQYMSEGMTPEEAEARAKDDLFWQVVESAASGAIMGAGFGGIGSAKAYSNAKNAALDTYGSDSQAVIDESLTLDPNNKLAQRLQGKLEAGKAPSTSKLGKLALQNVNAAESAMVEQDKARKQADREKAIKDINAQNRLAGKIHDKEALSKIAQTVTKALMGEQVSNAELRKVAENQAALTLVGKELGLKGFKVGTTTVSDLRSALAQKQSPKARLSTQNVISGFAAFFNMDEAAERSLMVNYAADVKNAQDGKTINPEDYAATYGAVYAAGKKGTDISEVSGDAAKVLSKTAIAQAYRAGQMEAQKNSQTDLQNGTDSDTIIKNAQEVQDEQGVYLRDSGEWNDGTNSQGQVPGMEGYAGQDQSRGEGRTRPRDSEAASLSYDREGVSAKSLGIKGGLTAKVRLVAEGSETTSMREAKRIAAERGLNVHFFGGGNLKIASGQKIISARAYIQGNDVYIRADHSRFTADQLMKHEAGHDMIAKGEVNVDEVRALIAERFTSEEIDAISAAYALAYENAGLDADDIWEEVVCDSLADMNVFEGRKNYEAAAEMAADFLPDLKKATLEAKKESTGPPKAQEGKASIDIGGENANENSSDTGILEGRKISTANRSGNDIREYSKNTRKLKSLLGYSDEYVKRHNIKAGETGWLEDYQGGLGFVDPREIQRMRRFLQSFRRNLSETKLKDTDTVGRKLPPYVLENFSNTVFKTQDGNILSLWHWTNRIFTKFKYGDIGFHAGVFDAAHAILFAKDGEGNASVFKELYFNSKNPLIIGEDLGKYWTPHLISSVSGVFNASEKAEIYSLDGSTRQQYDSEASIRLREMLKSKGYDSIVYINAWEGGISVIAFDSDQFYTVAENGIDVNDHTDGHASFDLESMDEDFGAVDAESDIVEQERSTREMLANMLESEDMSPAQKAMLTRYKNKIALISENEARIDSMTQELNALVKDGKGKVAKAENLRSKIRKLEAQNARYETSILNLEATQSIKRLLERERRAAYQEGKLTGQMAQGREDAAKLRRAEEKLAEQKRIERERLEAQREKTREKIAEQAKRYQESKAKSSEERRKSSVREKIKTFKDKLQNTLKHPTDRVYIPGALAQAMIDVCELIDTDTELYKADGTVNKAQEKRNETRERLAALREQYNEIKSNADPLYAHEYDEQIAEYLEKLEKDFKGKSLSEMSLAELEDMYGYLRSIDQTLRNARKIIGEKEAADAYEAGDKIIEEQRSIAAKRKNGERGAIKKLDDGISNQSLSPVRRVLEISGYDENSPLYKLFQSFERGVRSSEFFKMQAIKSFDPLTSGKKNAAIYERAVYEADGGDVYTDVNGHRFGISKMQKMQAVLSYERETINKKTHHIDKGGLVFADLKSLRDGNLRAATSSEKSHKVSADSAVKLIEKFKQELANDSWAQEYMATARIFFNETAKNAINDTYMKLKHRILATENAYIPFEVDQSSIVREISAQYDIQKTISSYGMLKDVQHGSVNPLIMTGLNNILDRHIDQVGTIQGLAVPIRNFNKVWNVKSVDGATNVREQIEKTAGRGAVKVIEQTVQDIQGERIRSDGFEPATRAYKKVKSNYIGMQFFWNASVMLKQLGSMFSATSKIRYRDPVRMMGNFIATMANRKKISAEVDKYTASAWMRGQGLSDAEIKTLSTERKRGWFGKAIQSGSKGMIYMDQTVALSLWKYCKQDVAKKTGLRGEELLRATAEYYNEVIETTQSMSDVLHRPEIQRSGGIGTELLGTFKTDLYQNAGNLRVAIGEFNHNRTQENATKLVKAVGAAMSSAMWGSIVTSLMAMIRYKVNRYRDEEDDELTAESWLKEQGTDLLEELVGYLIPLGGSEIFEAVRGLKDGKSFGNVLASAIPYDAVNDLYSDIAGLYQKLTTGKELTKSDYNNLIRDCGNVLGIPTANIMRTLQAIQLHMEDILNGEFLSFEAGLEDPNAYRLYKAILEGDADKIDKASRNYKNQEAITKAIRSQLRERDPRIREAAAELVDGNVAEYEKIFNEIYGEDNFEFNDILQAIYSEEESYYSKITDAATAKYHSDTEEYESVLDEIFERWENVLDEDRILSDIDAMEKTVAEGDDAVEEKISMFKAKHINIAFDNGDQKTALSVIEDIISLKVENALAAAERKASLTGEAFDEEELISETEDKAKSTLRSTMTKYWKPKYQQAYEANDTTEMYRIEDILYASGLYEYKSSKTLDDVLDEWLKDDEE